MDIDEKAFFRGLARLNRRARREAFKRRIATWLYWLRHGKAPPRRVRVYTGEQYEQALKDGYEPIWHAPPEGL